jgi:drug/metabolite transporter (DMT)-like permease
LESGKVHTYSALFGGLLLIGVSPILIKLADAPGIITTFYRMVIGGIALTPIFFFAQYKNKIKIPLRGLIIAALAGFCLATDMAFWTTGIMTIQCNLANSGW